jgi:N-carbamoyl-L-amino-acid hydrolase
VSFEDLWNSLLPIGREATGGYRRFTWQLAERECRAWFVTEAAQRDLTLEQDANGNLYAWWNPGSAPGVLTGSHFDSVPGGGAFDGPLGIVSAFAAFDLLRSRGFSPSKPLGIAAFAEEEGARFGVACLGSRLLTGEIAPERAFTLTDADGITFAAALIDGTTFTSALLADIPAETPAEHVPAALTPSEAGGKGSAGEDSPGGAVFVPAGGTAPGRDEALLARIGCLVELHVEQGRALEVPVGVASAIWPHGRWRLDFRGRGDHAGTTRLADRRDPMLPFAHTVIAARAAAERHESRATVGKVNVVPGGINAIASQVTAWLDARGPDGQSVNDTVADVHRYAREASQDHGVGFEIAEESFSEVVAFNIELRDRIVKVLGEVPVLPTGAGHDAGILSAHLPTAMLFVRNPTGVSHAPEEFAELADCLAGVEALATVLQDLAG